MLVSVNGKIDGAYMGAPECSGALREYGDIRGYYPCQTSLYDTVTMAGSYSAGFAPAGLKSSAVYSREDYTADSDVENYRLQAPAP